MSNNKLILVDIESGSMNTTQIMQINAYDPSLPANPPQPTVPNKYLKLTNLNNAWVLTKRHNGNTFFKRRGLVTNTKNYPFTDCIYYNEQEAKTEMELLNSVRKKCKYKIENASKYFVNNYAGQSNWNEVCIRNEAKPIKKVTKDTKIGSILEAHKFIVDRCQQNVNAYEQRIVSLQKELPIRIAEITKEYERRILDTSNERNKSKVELFEIQSLDLEKISELHETQGDKMVKVLYGKNTNEHQS